MTSPIPVSPNSETTKHIRHDSPGTARSDVDLVKILLVDDEPKNLMVLETILDDPGYQLIRADSADQALLALVRHEFALIVLDIQMPGMTGFEMAQMVKQRKKTAGIPIIFLTAYYSETEHVLEGYGSGAVDYLHKPVNPAILRSKVAVFAALHRTTRDAELARNKLQEEVIERRRIEEQLLQLNNELEERMAQRTAALVEANRVANESEELLRMAQEAGQVGLWSWDLRSGCGTWTPEAWNILDSNGVRGDVTYARWLSCIVPEDRDRAVAEVEKAKASGRYCDELRVNGDGSAVKWVELIGAVEFECREPVRMRGAVRDITERKTMELELKNAHRRKDEFLATLAHELRNPLAPIRNSLQILRTGQVNSATVKQVTEMMERQVHHLVRLIDDLLDVSRVMGGKIELRLEQVELASVVASALETVEPIMEQQGHTLHVSMASESLLVEGDPIRLAQVIGNLLGNSAKYTEPGGQVWLTGERDHDDVILRIRDSGIGISPEMLSRVFDLFVQVDQAATRSQGGLGIGLTLVKNLVEMHHGKVEVSSGGLGRGSEFVVRLPLSLQEPNPVSRPAGNQASGPLVPAGLKLLVVDDNQDAADSLAMLLQLHGHEVKVAYGGTAALEITKQYPLDAVFLDIGMPGMDGCEVARRMRQQIGLENVVLAALTGWGQHEDRRRTAQAGFNHHLVKPPESGALNNILTEVGLRIRAASAVRRILVVEDNVGAATVLSMLLKKIGPHEVELAHDGLSAVEKAQTFRPDIILLDIGLPRMDGYTAGGRRIRELEEGRDTLMAALTGHSRDEDRRESKDAGFDEHLVKPCGIEMLLQVLCHSKLDSSPAFDCSERCQ